MDRAILARVEKQAWFHRYPRGWPLLLFLLASIGTAIGVIAIERAESQRRLLELDRDTTEIASAIQRSVAENVALLRAGAALFETQEDVGREEFGDFVEELRGDGYLHGSLGMGWAPLIASSQLVDFEIAERDSGDSDFLVYPRPRGGRSRTAPIVYLDPLTDVNRLAIGYDMYSEEVRRAAMDAAMQSGQPIASGRVELVQDKAAPGSAGYLIYMPVGDSAGSGTRGFVYSPFRAEEFLSSAARLRRSRPVEIAVYDGERKHENLLGKSSLPGENDVSATREIRVAGRTWILQVSNKKPAALTPLSRLTIFFGAIAALLVMAIGQLITTRAAEDRKVLEWLSSQSAIRTSLTRELNHRVKNTLANVLSIAALTRRRSGDIDSFYERLTARIRALSATHDLLSQSDWREAPLGGVVRSELAPYMEGDGSVVDMDGPEIALAPNDAMSLGLAIHELATNAAKYGALSVPDGCVRIHWRSVTPQQAEVHWKEEGGPPVSEPDKRGFGRDLIEKVVASELGSDVDLRFEHGGVECTLLVPVRKAKEFTLRSATSATT